MYKDALKSVLLIILGALVAITACMPLYFNGRTTYKKYGIEQGMNMGIYMVIRDIQNRIPSIDRKLVPEDCVVDYPKAGSLGFIKVDGKVIVVPLK
jgi:hypothetical protein